MLQRPGSSSASGTAPAGPSDIGIVCDRPVAPPTSNAPGPALIVAVTHPGCLNHLARCADQVKRGVTSASDGS